MTSEDRAAIRARANAATPEPWTWEGDEPDIPCCLYGPNTDGSGIAFDRAEDGEFIAHARRDIPALLDALDDVDELARSAGRLADAVARADKLKQSAPPSLSIESHNEEAGTYKAIIVVGDTVTRLIFFGKIHFCDDKGALCGSSGAGNLTFGKEYVTCLHCLKALRTNGDLAQSASTVGTGCL